MPDPAAATINSLPGAWPRVLLPEIMDDPELDPEQHRRALRGLARINLVSRSAEILWPAIRRSARDISTRPLRVVDLACGGGDVLRSLAARAAACGLEIEWTGIDRSAVALDYARQRCHGSCSPISWRRLDICRDELSGEYDLAMNSLFMHHLTAEQAQRVFIAMAKLAEVVLINDLRRGRVAYAVAWCGTRLLSRSSVVHADGPQSVRAAWRVEELESLAKASGLAAVQITRVWPWRMLLMARRSPAR